MEMPGRRSNYTLLSQIPPEDHLHQAPHQQKFTAAVGASGGGVGAYYESHSGDKNNNKVKGDRGGFDWDLIDHKMQSRISATSFPASIGLQRQSSGSSFGESSISGDYFGVPSLSNPDAVFGHLVNDGEFRLKGAEASGRLAGGSSFSKSWAQQTEESYQLQLALALRLSSEATCADDPNFLDPVPDESSSRFSASPASLEAMSHRFWVNGCLSYFDKVPDGFYLIHGMDPYVWTVCSDLQESGRIPSIESLRSVDPSVVSSTEVILIDRHSDSSLKELQNRIHNVSLGCMTTAEVVEQLAKLVCNHMGGVASTGEEDLVPSWRECSVELKECLGSIVLPIGNLSVGLCRHRAVLFKVLADSIDLPCRIAKGCKYCNRDDASSCLVRFGVDRFQGVLKAKEKIVSINVNGVDAGFSMYLDNKGEAYFLRDVEMEVEESSNSVISSTSSSGEDTDGQSTTRKMPVKSTSVNYAGYESDSVTQIDISNVRVASRTNSRRSRIMGLVFGRKSVKQGLIEQDNDDARVVVRRDSLDRAEIAADLLEVKWSTNVRCSKKTGSGLSSQDVPKGNAREDKQIIDNSLINGAVADNSMEVVKISRSSNVKDHSRHDFHMTLNRLAEETGIEMSSLVPESSHEKDRAEDDGEPIKTGSFVVDDGDGNSNTMHTISEVSSAGIEIQDSMKHEFYPAEKYPNNPSFHEHEGSPESCFFTDDSETNGGPHLLSSETFASSRSELDQSFGSSTQTIDLVYELNFESNSFLDEKEHSRVEDVLEKTDYFVFPDNVKNTESPRISSSSMQKDDANIQTNDLVCDMNFESVSFLDEKEHSRVEDVLEKANYFVLPDNGKNTESPRISSNSMDKDVVSVHSIDLVCEVNSESTSSRDENEHSKVEDVLEKTDYFVLPDNEKNTERPSISSNSTEKDVGNMQTIDLVCEVNSDSEHFLDEKTQPSVEDVLEKTDYFVLSDTGKNPESHRISSYSMPKDVISENYSQMINVEPSYSSVEDEPHGIFTVSTFSNSTCQPLAEQTMRETSEERPSESSLPPHPKIDQALPNFFLAEVSEEERLLFGDIDDLKGIDSLEKNDPVVPLLCSSMDTPGSEILPSDAVDSRKELKTASSEVNIPETSVSQLGQGHKIAKSLPNMPIRDSDLDGHYSDSKLPDGEYDSKDANNMEQLKTGIGPGVGDSSRPSEGSDKSWRMWSFPFKKSRSFDVSQPPLSRNNSDSENIEDKNDQIEDENKPKEEENKGDKTKTKDTKKRIRVATPTSEQLASLNLKEGKNTVVFTFSTQMLGEQQVDARIFLWKWDTRIVISDVDGTITRSDLLGQVMPWVGVDWSQTGVTHLFSAIKENGYQLLFLSARAISQAYHTRQFLFNLKQDGKALPDGPVVISPDGLFPSLYREVVRRAPHEFKISCLEDIKALFPPDRNPFYAGFGNRDTDEFSYLKVGIPKGKIFIINPKGQIVVNRFVDTKSYTSFHTLVHDMFPSRTSFEQEDFNSWNFWKLPPASIDV